MTVHQRVPSTATADPPPLDEGVAAVRMTGVVKSFGPVRAVDGADLEIKPGEFFAMLGPSGSGKTTCLRLIAGFEQPDRGAIHIFGEAVAGVPPYRRAVNTVFQDYALFPHLDILANVAYGLRVRGLARAERETLARAALALVKLPGMETRRPSQLSGGQRQRVALARALVNRPKALLLDEPLGALDLKLREEMQVELKSLQRTLGLAFVFVTHDQSEALSMADRVAVFNEGRVIQVGTPEDVYERPRNRFVASFVGGSNVLKPEDSLRLGGPKRTASLRPEAISLSIDGAAIPAGSSTLDGVCVAAQYQGASRRVFVDCDGLRLAALVPARPARDFAPGTPVRLGWPPAAIHPMEDDA